jgi:hypothetical protein
MGRSIRNLVVSIGLTTLLVGVGGACSSSGGKATVATVGGGSSTVAAVGHGRAAALRAAAACIRQHGVPNMQDPTVSPDGGVYTDTRALQDASYVKNSDRQTGVVDAARSACKDLIDAANWNPDQLPPPPPAMVAAGVRSAECLRAHGLPNVKDPTPSSPYTPGHGFGMSQGELPANGKSDPTVQAALHACRPILDGEISASSLTNLARG